MGGSGADTLFLHGVTTGYVDAGAGADSLVFNGVVGGVTPPPWPPSLVVRVLTPSTSTTTFSTPPFLAVLMQLQPNRSCFDSTVDDSTCPRWYRCDTLTFTGKSQRYGLLPLVLKPDIFTFTTGATGSSILPVQVMTALLRWAGHSRFKQHLLLR